MNLLNSKWLDIPVAFIAIILGGCVTTQPIPEVSQSQSSGFGIDITLKAPIGLFTNKPDQVYFARIDGEDGLLQQHIVRSNYAKDGRAYFLNARPGTYVAVGAFFSRTMMAGPPQPGLSITLGGGKSGYTTYFQKEFVEQTKVTVREDEFVFMGRYVVDQSAGLEGADAVQAHYKNVIAPGATTSIFGMALGGDLHYRGTVAERKSDDQARNDFFRNAKEDLSGSAWAARIGQTSQFVVLKDPKSESVVLKDPKSGALMNCSSPDPGTKAMHEAMGTLPDFIKQCTSNLRKEGWLCVSGC